VAGITGEAGTDATGDGIISNKPRGLFISPPGLELAKLFRERMSRKEETLTIEKLSSKLPKLLTSDLELMEEFDMSANGQRILTKSTGSLYSDLCNEVRLRTRVCVGFGCPMCSAIACLLADATRLPVVLESNRSTPDGRVIETTYKLLEPLSSGHEGVKNPNGRVDYSGLEGRSPSQDLKLAIGSKESHSE
jgi:hypothetical protein